MKKGKKKFGLSDIIVIGIFAVIIVGIIIFFINGNTYQKELTVNELYEYIIAKCKETVPVVEHGEFGADMKVSLLNDGPFTIILDSDEIF